MQTNAAAAEPYGQVTSASSHGGSVQYRRRADALRDATNETDMSSGGPYPFSASASPFYVPRPLHNPLSQSLPQTHDKIHNANVDTHKDHAMSTLLACMYSLVILLRTAGQSSPVPLQATLFVGLLLYAADLSNLLRNTFVYVLLASNLGLTVTIIGASATGTMGPASLLVNATTTIMTLLVASLWILRHGIQWLGSSSSSIVSQQLQGALHAVLPPLTAIMTTIAMASLDVAQQHATRIPIVFTVTLAGTMLWIGAAQKNNATGVISKTRSSESIALFAKAPTLAADSDVYADNISKASNALSYCISPSMARGHVLLLLVLPTTVQLILQYGNRWTLVFWYDLIIVCGMSYLLQFAIVILDHARVRPSPYRKTSITHNSRYPTWFDPPTSVRTCLLPMIVTLAFCFAIQQRYLIALSQSFAH
jgi:hypothetical protein